jgi:iron complex outermembrane receptor protein
VQTDGSLGLYEFGNSVQVRAYNLDQIGFVVDGIPTGRSDPFGGSPVFRYVDNENLGSVVASAGAGDVSVPSYSSLGPVVRYNSIAPQKKAGLFVSEALGQFNLRRNFIRASTGQLGPISAYVSRTKLDSDLWRGAGGVHRTHWEAQLHADLGGDSWARLKFVSNDFHDNDSPTLTRAQYTSTTPDLGGKTGRYRGYIDTPPNTTPGFAPSVAGVPIRTPTTPTPPRWRSMCATTGSMAARCILASRRASTSNRRAIGSTRRAMASRRIPMQTACRSTCARRPRA